MPIYADKKAGKATGRWRVEVQKNGQRFRSRHDTHKEAQEEEKRIKTLLAQGKPVEGAVVRKDQGGHLRTLGEAMKAARGTLWRGNASELNCWQRMDHIALLWGSGTLMDDIGTLKIDQLIKDLREGTKDKEGIADGTINRYLSHLNKFLKWSKARGFRTAPLDDLDFDWQTESEGRIRWITETEEAQLQALLPANCWKATKIGLETGCRKMEILTCEPDQINGNRLHLWKTKTNTPRTVPMDAVVTRMLKDLVNGGTMPTEAELRYHWEKARSEMGLSDDPDFVFHATRHTCATRLVEAGVNLRVIQQFLGHKTIQTTMRYSHVRDETLEMALVQREQHRKDIHLITETSGPHLPKEGYGHLKSA